MGKHVRLNATLRIIKKKNPAAYFDYLKNGKGGIDDLLALLERVLREDKELKK
jgi:hypothetical protein